MARGIDADEVLPEWTMSSATTMSSRAPALRSRLATASMMRRLAWCGTKTSMSSGARPASSIAFSATGAILVVAQRKTACPSWDRAFVSGLMWIVWDMSPALPQVSGPIPSRRLVHGRTDHRGTGSVREVVAVERSVQSIQSDSFSAPITEHVPRRPAGTRSAAVPMA